jgi:hypothetical protein
MPTPLEFLQAVYCNEGLPLSVRLRAAIEAAPFVHPKLAVTAVLAGDDFASRLDAAIARSAQTKVIDAAPAPQNGASVSSPLPPTGPTPTKMGAPFPTLRRL